MIAKMDGVRWEAGILYADKNRAAIELSFEGLPGHDTYLRINNLNVLSGGNNMSQHRQSTVRQRLCFAKMLMTMN